MPYIDQAYDGYNTYTRKISVLRNIGLSSRTYMPPSRNVTVISFFWAFETWSRHTAGMGEARISTYVATFRIPETKDATLYLTHRGLATGIQSAGIGTHWKIVTKLNDIHWPIAKHPTASRVYLSHRIGKIRRYRYSIEILMVMLLVL